MSQFRFARIGLMLAAIGLNAAPVLITSAHAQAAAKPAAAPAEAPKEGVRPEVFKLIDTAVIKDLMAKKNYSEVQTRVTQAEAIGNLSAYEIYIINSIKARLGAATNNDAMTIPALESMLASGRLQPAEEGEYLLVLGDRHNKAKNFAKAIDTLKRYKQLMPASDRADGVLARAHYQTGDFASARDVLLTILAATEKAGKAPDNEDLRLLGSSAAQIKDMQLYSRTLEKLVAHYPAGNYWADLISRTANKPGVNQRHQMDFFRLQHAAVKTMKAPAYVEMAELALIGGFPAEAKKVVDAGFAAKVLGEGADSAKHKQLRDKANKVAADDAKNIGAEDARAAKAKDGNGLVNLGYAYVTMDQFDKGIGLMERGIAKGTGTKADEAKLHLGVAYFKAGRSVDALKTFAGIKGNDGPGDLARLWTMLINNQGKAAAPVAAAN